MDISTPQKSFPIFCQAVLFRLTVYILSVFVLIAFSELQESPSLDDFLNAWVRWDSPHYMNIASNGYMGAIENGEHIFLVFFPLFPWLMRTANLLFGNMALSGLFVSTLCFGIGSVYFYKLMCKDFSEQAARFALYTISTFPWAFFFGSVATESVFFMTATICLYYIRRHKWLLVAFWGMLSCLCKVQGLLLCFAVLVELFHFKRGFHLLSQKRFKSFCKRILLPGIISALLLTGVGIYLLINYYVEGDPFRFLYYQHNHWYNSTVPIWETIAYLYTNATTSFFTPDGIVLWVPEFILFFIYLLMIGYGIKNRLRPMYTAYFIAFFILTYSSSWLISAGRYTLSAFPLFMLLGHYLSKHPKARIPLLSCFLFGMTFLYICYFKWMQVM